VSELIFEHRPNSDIFVARAAIPCTQCTDGKPKSCIVFDTVRMPTMGRHCLSFCLVEHWPALVLATFPLEPVASRVQVRQCELECQRLQAELTNANARLEALAKAQEKPQAPSSAQSALTARLEAAEDAALTWAALARVLGRMVAGLGDPALGMAVRQMLKRTAADVKADMDRFA
jgi:hypothetical protein